MRIHLLGYYLTRITGPGWTGLAVVHLPTQAKRLAEDAVATDYLEGQHAFNARMRDHYACAADQFATARGRPPVIGLDDDELTTMALAVKRMDTN